MVLLGPGDRHALESGVRSLGSILSTVQAADNNIQAQELELCTVVTVEISGSTVKYWESNGRLDFVFVTVGGVPSRGQGR